ncbi:PPE domain-containing protein [Mycobacterium intracellulare]|uniref:PPE domain-containing protein n=1 Tax=Mycobacterium intracellulare TaxID=1767 RepID=UPI0002529871|nr:PPE domain-containing protein [Mycobacterium intracellulare]AFC48788.1 PPE family protein [Mycobacterium intracellulare MOTT-02]ASW95373.1 PPE family protein [Mycobacterium intracellulare]MCA2230960.1 PPE family protein [Mycobacterium intracellulare]MDM3895844.1 PPE domain-containing protein [Mycobacterium intracellulare]PBA22247.1 PPE family protein [Mycobacterium intracellulare]
MTAPIFAAFPPEVHSTLLSSGPGPAPLLAAATAWSSMSTDYATAAAELSGLLGAVQAGAWDGPSADQYVAAHVPYQAWLVESAAKSATAASLHETAATAYTAALAAMPTMGELTANHAVHGALVATNFFGINTIPIAVNEADYARMWVQAATTMTTYQAVSESALAAVPPTTPAPPIVVPGAEAGTAGAAAMQAAAVAPATDSGSNLNNADTSSAQQQATQYPSWMDQLTKWLQQYTQNFAWPVSKDLNPGGWPFPPVPWVNSLASFFGQLGLSPALSTALGWAIFHTLMIFWPFIQLAIQMAVVLAPVVVAAIGAAAAGGAAAAVTAISVGIPLASAPSLPAVAAAPAPVVAPAPTIATAPASVSHVSAPSTAPATTVAGSAGGGPVGGGPGVGFGPTATDGIGAGLSNALYAVGLSGLSARGSASSRSRRKSEEPSSDDVEAPAGAAAAAAAKKKARARRRRGGTATERAYRYEFMDLDQDGDPGVDSGDPFAARPSEDSAGPLGFAGAAAKSDAARAAGLATLTRDGFSDGPSVPMMPSTWDRD